MQLHGPAKSLQLAQMSHENKVTRQAWWTPATGYPWQFPRLWGAALPVPGDQTRGQFGVCHQATAPRPDQSNLFFDGLQIRLEMVASEVECRGDVSR